MMRRPCRRSTLYGTDSGLLGGSSSSLVMSLYEACMNLMGSMVMTDRNELRQIQKPKMIVFSVAMGTLRKLLMRSSLREAAVDEEEEESWMFLMVISVLRCSQSENDFC